MDSRVGSRPISNIACYLALFAPTWASRGRDLLTRDGVWRGPVKASRRAPAPVRVGAQTDCARPSQSIFHKISDRCPMSIHFLTVHAAGDLTQAALLSPTCGGDRTYGR